MKISDRLKAVASFVKENANVADVGADHGLLEIYLINEGKINSILAIENKSGPFSILKNNLEDYDVKLSLSDGISKIDETVDTIVLAGMGGILINNILNSNKTKLTNIKQIVVDAHRDIKLVRENICKLGFYIEQEKIVYEKGTYYFVISFLKGHHDYSLSEYEWGYKIKEDPLFEDFRKEELNKLVSNLIKYRSSSKSTLVGIKQREEQIGRLEKL